MFKKILTIKLFNYLYIIIVVLGFPDPLDLATGIEKKEMLARLAGNDVSLVLNSTISYY